MNPRILALIVLRCKIEVETGSPAADLAQDILEALGLDEDPDFDQNDLNFSEQDLDKHESETLARIIEYTAEKGNCTPELAVLVDDDLMCPVYKVVVKSFDNSWIVPPPKFWYVCPVPVMNIYRNDHQSPDPWKKEQNDETVIDYIKSFHLGLSQRVMTRDNEEDFDYDKTEIH